MSDPSLRELLAQAAAYPGTALRSVVVKPPPASAAAGRRGFVEAEASYPECAEAIRLIGALLTPHREAILTPICGQID